MRKKKSPKWAGQQRRKPELKKNTTKREMDHIATGWMINYARVNIWRVPSIYGLDDLIQEGYWCWQYVLSHYPKVKDMRHLMALFKLTLHSHFTNLSNKKTKEELIISYFLIEPNALDLEESNLHILLKNAPPDIRAVLEIFADQARLKFLRRTCHRRRSNGTRETTSEMLSRVAGLPPTPDLVGRIQEYFSPQ